MKKGSLETHRPHLLGERSRHGYEVGS